MRPVSPYLSIYKPQIGSIFSIFGRITGVALLVCFIAYLCCHEVLSFGLSFYFFYTVIYFAWKSSSFFMGSCLLFLIINVFYHLLFSLRYLYWSKTGGMGNLMYMTLENVYKVSYSVLGVLVFLSILTWLFI